MKKTRIAHSLPAVARANGIDLVYDTFGNPEATPVLLIMGFAMQMIGWDPEFCKQLAAHGYWVIRFDNRDIGLSSKCEAAGIPQIPKLLFQKLLGKMPNVPYTLEVMAADTRGLLNALAIKSAHIVGVSMGGMIGQLLAIHHPQRVRSLTVMMSSSGELPDLKDLQRYVSQGLTALLPFQRQQLPAPQLRVLKYLMSAAPQEREMYIEHGLRVSQALNGRDLQIDQNRARQRAADAFDRGVCPEGAARQLAAVLASKSRLADLRKLKCPVLIIHGKADPLVPPQASITMAQAIPGSTLKLLQGMGHALPPQVWPPLLDALSTHFLSEKE